nr:reverse transcriptase domain-containing protein [Tanacetum cinerariifolium]
PPSPNYIPGPEEPQTPPAPQDEDEHKPMFIQPHDPDFVPEPIYPEYIPLEDNHILLAEEQPLPHVVSPTAESPGYVAESDPEEDPEEYEDDETEDGPVDYPMDGGDDDDGDSSGYDADDEDEDEEDKEEEEHLAPADFTVVIPTDELISPLEGIEPVIPPPSTDTATTGARITVRLQSFHQRQRCTTPTALSSPPLPPPLHMPPPIDRRDDIPETEMPPCKRLCLSNLGSRYEVEESSTARPTDSQGIDYGFASTLDAEARRRRIGEVGYEDAQDSSTRISQRVDVDSQQVDLLMEDMIAHQETIQIVEDEAYATREAWMQQTGTTELQETNRRHQAQMAMTLRVIGDMRREMGDILHEDNRRNVQTARPCFYADFMKCQPLNFNGTEGVGEIKKLEIELWNLKVKKNNVSAYTKRFQELTLICTKFVVDETRKIDKYVSGLPDNIYGSMKASKPKMLDETIELANELMDQKLCIYAERQSNNKRKADESIGHFKRDCPKLKNKDGEKVNAPGWVYAVG